MKQIMLVFVFGFFAACGVEDSTPAMPVVDDFKTEDAVLLKRGNLEGINHIASGVASVYKNGESYAIVLDPYSSQNGPDLKIYLSKDEDATEYLRLGNLKSTMGKQSYKIPAGTDLSQYSFVHVWCEKYTVVFARAELK